MSEGFVFNGLIIDHPFFLTALLLLIPMIIFDFAVRKKNVKLEKNLSKKAGLSSLFFYLFLVFSIIALSGPRWGTALRAGEFRRGLDVVFAFDVSRSMDIQDAQGNEDVVSRLKRGLSIAEEAVTQVSGARFAAAIGRGRGYLTVPLTWDNEAVLSFIHSLDGSSMTGRSTNLEALVEAAAASFHSSSPSQKVIVLLSDGEAHEGVLANALARCAREGIIIFSVALGSDSGRPVPGLNTGMHETPVISRRNVPVMRMAADRTGGVYIDGARADAAQFLSSNLLSIAQGTRGVSSSTVVKERRTLFIILALICYGALKFVKRIPELSSFGVLLVSIVFILTSCTDGKLLLLEANYLSSRGRYDEAVVPYIKALDDKDASAYAEYGLGLVFYSRDEGSAAINRFNNSRKQLENYPLEEHRELRYRLNYNSGIIYFEEGDYHSAVSYFRDALRLDPGRVEAKRNLELSLLSINKEAELNERSESSRENETREILFDYLRDRDRQHWRSREWSPEENYSGFDY